MTKKKCFVCGKGYNGILFKHIWTHPEKTEQYLKAKRKSAPKKSRKSSEKGLITALKAFIAKYD